MTPNVLTAPAVRERPILMSGPMVRATLDDRKAQTRRVVLPQPPAECSINYPLGNESWLPVEQRTPFRHLWEAWSGPLFDEKPSIALCGHHHVRCPYGAVGDRLWVRETLRRNRIDDWCYSADGRVLPDIDRSDPRAPAMYEWAHRMAGEKDVCVSIHMPRWASRITMEITGVRVERLQAISEEDAIAEGCFDEREHDGSRPSDIYRQLWDSLNAKRGYSWDRNPWVWVLEFRRTDGA